jgi:hypothetical protein
MSFGAMTAWQAAVLLAAAGAAAAWLFLLKVRPPRVPVPSLLLWRRVFDHPRELTWWERVRRAVSLVATILIAVSLALAVTRPGPRLTAASRGRTLVVLDSSWSMAARMRSGGTRWDAAVARARAIAAASGGEEVALATTADGLVEGPTSDQALVETAIDRLAPSGGDLAAWPRVAGADAVHFITDGAVARPLEPGVEVHSVFETAENAGIVAFGARPAAAGAPSGEAYLQIANYATAPQKVRATVSRGSDRIADQTLDMAAGESISVIVPLAPTGSARLLAHITADRDALDVDNDAVAWLDGTDPLEVAVVSDAPGALALLLTRDPSVRAAFFKPADYRPGRENVVIFDRIVPAQAPSKPALFIAPQGASWLGRVTGEEKGARWVAPGTHPVVAGVDPLTVVFKRAEVFSGDGLSPVARSIGGTPLVSVLDSANQRAVIWAFALADSNLAFAPAFPVLAGNALDWLGRPSYGVLRRPGPVQLPSSTARVTAPDGRPVDVVRAGDRVVARLSTPGLYLVEAGKSRGVVGVNVGDPDVSNLTRSLLPETASRDGARTSGWPWWMWAVLVGFVLIATEWWTWQRRITV